jgi:hypothetical protein
LRIGRAPGDGSSKPLSPAMHGWHDSNTSLDASCYSCHPGPATQFLRTAIQGMGYSGDNLSCQDGACHGGIIGVAAPQRTPWVTERNCEQCHGSNYSTGGTLYRHAKHSDGLYCAACYNSSPAWWPSKLWADNVRPTKLQGNPTSVGDCIVCHTTKQTGDSPHVTYYRSE